jgi:UPF0755 protein
MFNGFCDYKSFKPLTVFFFLKSNFSYFLLKSSKAMKKLILAFFVLILLVLTGLGGFGYWIYSAVNAPHAHGKTNQFIAIQKGTPPNEIIAKLAAEGIIKNGFATEIYLRFFGDASKLKAGEYQFESPITPLQVLEELEKGEERTTKLTIPEGWTRFEIAKRIAEKFPQNPPMDEKTVLYLMDDVSLIKDLDPNAKNLEGYLYPTTYSFPKDSKPQDVIKRMVDQFRRTWKPEWTLQAQKLGKTNQQIVTIASLIENESKFAQERGVVSSVIYNRLDKGMKLGIDATNVYIAKILGKWDGTIHKSDIEIEHPYNTRKIAGLPPGPISSASESSLEAALNPKQTDYLFYVLNVEKNDGSHNFYASAAEFERGKQAYQTWLDQQRAKKREENSQ